MEKIDKFIEILDGITPDLIKAFLFLWVFIGVLLILFIIESIFTGIPIFVSQVFILYWNKHSNNQLYKAMQKQWRKLKKRL